SPGKHQRSWYSPAAGIGGEDRRADRQDVHLSRADRAIAGNDFNLNRRLLIDRRQPKDRRWGEVKALRDHEIDLFRRNEKEIGVQPLNFHSNAAEYRRQLNARAVRVSVGGRSSGGCEFLAE